MELHALDLVEVGPRVPLPTSFSNNRCTDWQPSILAHRLLQALVPILWLRTLIGLLVMPLLVDTAQ